MRRLFGLLLVVACSGQTRAPAEPGPLALVLEKPEEHEAQPLPDDEAPPTTSPQPAAPTDPRLASACAHWDSALNRVAEDLANAAAAGRPAAESSEVAAKLRSAGAPYVWPRAWTLSGGKNVASDIEPRLQAWLESQGATQGEPRCGGAVVTGPNHRMGAAVLLVDAVADLSPVAPRVRVGSWVEIQATFLAPSAGAKVLALGPRGRPRSVPTSLDGTRVRARFSADCEGPWLIQVLGDLRGGPRPVLEALVIAGLAPRTVDLSRAPGEDATASSDEATLLAMLNTARRSEKLADLLPNAELTALAREQAEELRAARRLAHDLGAGDPLARMERVGLDASTVGENVAYADTLAHAHRALWNSPSHRSNLLNDRFDSIGIGVSIDPDGGVWVAELFARLGS